MKNIEINEKQKENLLEMCKELFPGYDFTLDKWDQCFVTLGLKSKVAYDSHIHWFEFCMNHLAKKILDNSSGDINTSELGYFSCGPIEEIHPIDYLYEEFKKLK